MVCDSGSGGTFLRVQISGYVSPGTSRRPNPANPRGFPAALPFNTPGFVSGSCLAFPKQEVMWGRLNIQRERLSFLLPGLLPEFSLPQPLAPESPGPSLPLPPPGLPLWGAGPRDCSASPGPQPRGSWCRLPMGCGQLWDDRGQGSLTGWCEWHSALGHLEPLARQTDKFWHRRGR